MAMFGLSPLAVPPWSKAPAVRILPAFGPLPCVAALLPATRLVIGIGRFGLLPGCKGGVGGGVAHVEGGVNGQKRSDVVPFQAECVLVSSCCQGAQREMVWALQHAFSLGRSSFTTESSEMSRSGFIWPQWAIQQS